MNVSNNRLPGGVSNRTLWSSVALIGMMLVLQACGGGSGAANPAPNTTPPTANACVPSDPSTADECGTLILGLTDADGDFDSYAVDVVSIQLEKANGTIVETLPATTRIDFTDYVNLTEFVTAATIPPGVYVSGSITLDYTNAEVFVEFGDTSKEAIVVDDAGAPLGQTTLNVRLSDRDQLLITRGRPSLLTLDFDLEASHDVDVVPTPAVAVAEPFIVAEIDPVDSKDIRVRGPLVETNETEMTYVVALRPFHDRANDFGRATVNVTDETEFEVDGAMFTGVEGLRALEGAGQGTLTVAQGTLDVANREFTANLVLAGSSVPGSDRDAIRGNVVSRVGNELTVRGGTVYLRGLQPYYFGDMTVTVGPETRVFKTTFDGELAIDDISVGQNVWVRGDVTVDADSVSVDATAGAVRMNVTHLSGFVNTMLPGQIDIELRSIDRKRISLFDFTGTGMTPDTDADPMNYEIATGNLSMDAQSVGEPVTVWGFPSAFGAAPPDFEGRTIIDYTDVRSALGVGWGANGTAAPFLMIDSTGLLLDNQNPDIDQRHYIKKGPVLIDLTALDSNTLIAPRESGRMLFTIKTRDSLQLFADFTDFSNALAAELASGANARSMYARGTYDSVTNTLSAYKIGVHLLEAQ
ncbi:MAG: hypothetical protein AAF417_14080 [Pseudomonadota bacterium]